MALELPVYARGDSVLHRLDARVKIIMLFACSCAVLATHSWWGLAVCAIATTTALALARTPVQVLFKASMPVLVLALFSFLLHVIANPQVEGVLAGAFFALRMILLVDMSFVLCFTTTSEDLLAAFTSLMKPLRKLHVPVDDIALTLALSVRFIPVIAQEFARVRSAQQSRGGDFGSLSIRQAMRTHAAAFAAVFVGLFRRADTLAFAMDSRCYGATTHRSTLRVPRLGARDVAVGFVVSLSCLVVGVFL